MLPQFEEKSLYLELSIAPDTPEIIETDSKKLRQIIKNFLSNAVKFTSEGGVTIQVAKSADPDRPLRISAQDSGIGIAPDKQDSIFGAFKQADGSTSRKYGGTGLGLTISQELAHLMGGRIELASEPGTGATFSLLLPLSFPRESVEPDQIDDRARAPRPTAPTEYHTTGEPTHEILIVDQDVQNLVRITPMLKQLNVRIHAAGDEDEAMETLADEECALVLIDIMLPDSYSYVTIRHIRGNPDFAQIPVIGLIADSAEEDKQKYLDAGITAFIGKPASSAALKNLLEHYLPKE